MRKIFFLSLIITLNLINVNAQGPLTPKQQYVQDSTAIARLSATLLNNSTCYTDLKTLCKTIGHRLTGTASAEQAVEWGRKTLIQAGCDKVYLQPVMVPKWVRGSEEVTAQLRNGEKINLEAIGIGNAIGTQGFALTAPIIEVSNFKELEQLGVDNIRGKIVFLNHMWNQAIINPFKEYGPCVEYRWAGPSKAAQYGAVGIIIRSAGSGYDNFAHTGSMRYDSLYKKIPACAISYNMAEKLQQLIKAKQVSSVSIKSDAHFDADVLSYNVIGEITGTDQGAEIITIGGHLDSWDVGEGAQDDGAGVVQCIDVVRAFKKTGMRPRRTIRCVLFMNEENGLRGGKEYAKQAQLKNERHLVAIETDAGAGSPRGFSMTMPKESREKIKNWVDLFYPLGVYNFDEDGGGADISPLQQNLKVPVMELLPDPQSYFEIHHTNNDVFERVNRRELVMGSVAIAAMVYMISEHGL